MKTVTPESLADSYSYREIKAAMAILDGGPAGFDLFRDDRTRAKLGLARYVLSRHSGDRIIAALPKQEMVVDHGEGRDENLPVSEADGAGADLGGGGAGGGQNDQADGEGNPSEAGKDAKGKGKGRKSQQQGGQGEAQAAQEGAGGGGKGEPGQGESQGNEAMDALMEALAAGGQPSESQGQQGQGGQSDEHPLVAAVRKVVREELPKQLTPALEAVGKFVGEEMNKVEQTASKTPPVDQAAVQAIVDKAMESAKPRSITIKVKDAPAVELKAGQFVNSAFDELLAMIAAGQNVALCGPAGCGKTYMAHLAATALNLPFGSISYSAGASEAWLLGRSIPNLTTGLSVYQRSKFCELYVIPSVFLHDEFDGADPNMALTVNAALANGGFDNPVSGERLVRDKDAHQVAAVNTFGTGADAIYVGRNQMDEATRDRWYFIPVDYDRNYEASLAPSNVVDWVWKVRDGVMQNRLRKVMSTRAIQKAAAGLAAGRKWPEIQERLLGGWSRDERAKCGV